MDALTDRIKRFWADAAFAKFVARRCPVREVPMVRRRSDGTLWAAWHPQNYAYAMRGLFSKNPRDKYHFAKVREWKGCYFVSPKTFWLPADEKEFHLVSTKGISALVGPPLPEPIECARIDFIRGEPPPKTPTPAEVGARIRLVPRTANDER